MAKIIPTDKARQGRSGVQVLTVLISALVLAAIVWAGVEFYGESIDTSATTGQTTTNPPE